MRKLAPAFVLTTIVALSSGSALALGDMNKNKSSPKPDVTAPADARTDGAATPKDVGRAGVSGNAATPPAVSSTGTPMTSEPVSVARKGFNCEGIATTDPLYTTHNCGATKGGPGSSGGSAGAAGSSSGSSQ